MSFPLDLQGRSLGSVEIGTSVDSFLRPGAVTVHDTYSLSEDVIVEISTPGSSVKAILPSKFGMGITNKWVPAIGQLTDTKMLAGLNQAMEYITGGESFSGNPLFSRLTYKGTDPISIPLELNFVDQLDPYKNVWLPVTKLMQMASPKLSKDGGKYGTVIIPGPLAFREITKELNIDLKSNPVTLRFGRLLKFYNCFITSLNVTFDSYMVGSYPSSATVSLVIGTQDSISVQDFEQQAKNLSADESLSRLGFDDFRSKVVGF